MPEDARKSRTRRSAGLPDHAACMLGDLPECRMAWYAGAGCILPEHRSCRAAGGTACRSLPEHGACRSMPDHAGAAWMPELAGAGLLPEQTTGARRMPGRAPAIARAALMPELAGAGLICRSRLPGPGACRRLPEQPECRSLLRKPRRFMDYK